MGRCADDLTALIGIFVFIAILMTALASGLGFLPLALAQGEPGSEIQAPMAVVILCGLVSSTALNMVVIPALYKRFGHFEKRAELAD